jgi:hypothetical protein
MTVDEARAALVGGQLTAAERGLVGDLAALVGSDAAGDGSHAPLTRRRRQVVQSGTAPPAVPVAGAGGAAVRYVALVREPGMRDGLLAPSRRRRDTAAAPNAA